MSDNVNLMKPASELTKKEYACIQLKLPMTGDKDLNKIIMLSQKRDMAQAILNGILSKKFDDPEEQLTESIDDSLEYMEKLIDALHAHSKSFRKFQDPFDVKV